MKQLLNFLENYSYKKKFLNWFFMPIFFFLEYIVYWYYWKNIIVKEILTSDKVVEFLDKNEFGYFGNKFAKIDLLASNKFFDRNDFEEARFVIKGEFIAALTEQFSNYIVFDIENYINIMVDVEMKVVKENGEVFRAKVYSVTMQFYRYYYIQEYRKRIFMWFFINSIITEIVYLVITKFNLFFN